MKFIHTLIVGLLCFFLGLSPTFAQIISTNPATPQLDEPLKIVFDAAEGTAGLKDFSGDVYAHTGVILTPGGSWTYAPTWGDNSEKYKLKALGNNKWEFTIAPTIRDFYGMAADEKAHQLAFVFRSQDAGLEGKDTGGKDIFVQVFDQSLAVKLDLPSPKLIFVDASETIQVAGTSLLAEKLEIYVDNVLVELLTTPDFDYQLRALAEGTHHVKIVGYDADSNTTEQQFSYTVRQATQVAALPAGLHDGINRIDATTVTFVLHAPHKQSVYLLGDFNDWQLSSRFMLKASSANTSDEHLRYWITIDGLEAGQEYAFQYVVDESLRITDPYVTKVLDPWNDAWIPAETYPNLKAYPTNKTTGVVGVFQTTPVEYAWQVSKFDAPKKTDLVIYELLLRDFTAGPEGKEGNLKNALQKLDYLKELGVNAIELLPVNEFEGNSSWGYNPSFMFAVDKAYGTEADLKRFVDACHERGMAVLVDVVMNHAFGLSPFVQLYLDRHDVDETISLPESPWFNIKSPNSRLKWGADFNHESIHTQNLLDRVNRFWLTEFRVDGFRFDFTKGFTNQAGDGQAYDASRIAILKRMYDKINEVNPKAYVILEHLTDNSEEKELADYGMMLWGNMNHTYNEATMGYTENAKSDLSATYYKHRNWSTPHLVSYMESHDEERLMYKNLMYGAVAGDYNTKDIATALQRNALAANFFFTIPGPKMIWQFGELGYDISINMNVDGEIDADDPVRYRTSPKPIRWDYWQDANRKRLYQVYAHLCKLKTEEEAFESGKVQYSLSDALKSVVLDGDETDFVLVGNFSLEAGSIGVDFTQTGTWYNYYTGQAIEVNNTSQQIELEPGEYQLYASKQFETPVFPVLSTKALFGEGVRIYPIPTHDWLHITNAVNLSRLSLYTLQGKHVKSVDAKGQDSLAVNMSGMPAGNLLLILQAEDGRMATQKIVKQ